MINNSIPTTGFLQELVELMQECRKNWGLGFPAISGELLGGFWQAHALRNLTAGENAVKDRISRLLSAPLDDTELRFALKELVQNS